MDSLDEQVNPNRSAGVVVVLTAILALVAGFWSVTVQAILHFTAPMFPLASLLPAIAGTLAFILFIRANWSGLLLELRRKSWAEKFGPVAFRVVSVALAFGYAASVLLVQPMGAPANSDYFFEATGIALISLSGAWLESKTSGQVAIKQAERNLMWAVAATSLFMLFIWGWASAAGYDVTFQRVIAVVVAMNTYVIFRAPSYALLSAIRGAEKIGIRVSNPLAFEKLSRVKLILIGKTRLLTTGERAFVSAHVTRRGGLESEAELLAVAAGLEAGSESAIALAILDEAAARGVVPAEVKDIMVEPGIGVSGRLAEFRVYSGGPGLLTRLKIDVDVQDLYEADRLNSLGHTVVYVVRNDLLLGYLAISDEVKPSAAATVARLQDLHHSVGIVTSDAYGVAKHMQAVTSADQIFAEVLPHKKPELLTDLAAQPGGVALVGNGHRDEDSLKAATVGISVEHGPADISFGGVDPSAIAAIAFLSRRLAKRQFAIEVLGWGANLLLVMFAAGVFTPKTWAPPALLVAALSFLISLLAATLARRLRGKK